MFGSAVVEHLVTVANGRICGWADANAMVALPHYSPGYSGWDVADQVKLWNLLRQNHGGGFPGELEVLETGMLRPKKSLLAVVGVTRNLESGAPLCRVDSVRKLFAAGLPVSPGTPASPAAATGRHPPVATFPLQRRACRAKEFCAGPQCEILGQCPRAAKMVPRAAAVGIFAGRLGDRVFSLRRHDVLEHGPPAGV